MAQGLKPSKMSHRCHHYEYVRDKVFFSDFVCFKSFWAERFFNVKGFEPVFFQVQPPTDLFLDWLGTFDSKCLNFFSSGLSTKNILFSFGINEQMINQFRRDGWSSEYSNNVQDYYRRDIFNVFERLFEGAESLLESLKDPEIHRFNFPKARVEFRRFRSTKEFFESKKMQQYFPERFLKLFYNWHKPSFGECLEGVLCRGEEIERFQKQRNAINIIDELCGNDFGSQGCFDRHGNLIVNPEYFRRFSIFKTKEGAVLENLSKLTLAHLMGVYMPIDVVLVDCSRLK